MDIQIGMHVNAYSIANVLINVQIIKTKSTTIAVAAKGGRSRQTKPQPLRRIARPTCGYITLATVMLQKKGNPKNQTQTKKYGYIYRYIYLCR